MIELTLKKDVPQNKIDALLHFLKSWDIEAEIKTITPIKLKKKTSFSLSAGIWKDHTIQADDLRKQAWDRNK